MTPTGRFLRFLRLCLAALQVALPTAAVVADAILEADAARAYTHLEPHSSKSCPQAHSADDCILCQFGNNHAAGVSHLALEIWLRDAGLADAPLPVTAPAAFSADSPLPRAPPPLS